jgi:hypothetical protein
MLNELSYHFKLYLNAIVIVVFYFGLRYVIGIRIDMVKYFLDSSKPLIRRLGLFFLVTSITFVGMVIIIQFIGKRDLLF